MPKLVICENAKKYILCNKCPHSIKHIEAESCFHKTVGPYPGCTCTGRCIEYNGRE
jgi:hypothetical protein